MWKNFLRLIHIFIICERTQTDRNQLSTICKKAYKKHVQTLMFWVFTKNLPNLNVDNNFKVGGFQVLGLGITPTFFNLGKDVVDWGD